MYDLKGSLHREVTSSRAWRFITCPIIIALCASFWSVLKYMYETNPRQTLWDKPFNAHISLYHFGELSFILSHSFPLFGHFQTFIGTNWYFSGVVSRTHRLCVSFCSSSTSVSAIRVRVRNSRYNGGLNVRCRGVAGVLTLGIFFCTEWRSCCCVVFLTFFFLQLLSLFLF
mgnify:CR=1 FL=1